MILRRGLPALLLVLTGCPSVPRVDPEQMRRDHDRLMQEVAEFRANEDTAGARRRMWEFIEIYSAFAGSDAVLSAGGEPLLEATRSAWIRAQRLELDTTFAALSTEVQQAAEIPELEIAKRSCTELTSSLVAKRAGGGYDAEVLVQYESRVRELGTRVASQLAALEEVRDRALIRELWPPLADLETGPRASALRAALQGRDLTNGVESFFETQLAMARRDLIADWPKAEATTRSAIDLAANAHAYDRGHGHIIALRQRFTDLVDHPHAGVDVAATCQRLERELDRRELEGMLAATESRVDAAAAGGRWGDAAKAYTELVAELAANTEHDPEIVAELRTETMRRAAGLDARRDLAEVDAVAKMLAACDIDQRRNLIQAMRGRGDLSDDVRALLDEQWLAIERELASWDTRAQRSVIAPFRRGDVQVANDGIAKLRRDGAPRAVVSSLEARVPAVPGEEGLDWVKIRAGYYWVGTPENEYGRDREEILPRRVRIDRDYHVASTEVTQAVFRRFVPTKQWDRFRGDRLPAHSVTYDEANEFCELLNRAFPRLHYSLPSESQWEVAARGAPIQREALLPIGTNSPADLTRILRGGGNVVQLMKGFAVFKNNSDASPKNCGSKKPNSIGLYDVAGNVYEWCRRDPSVFGEDSGRGFRYAPLRGGSYVSHYRDCRSGARTWEPVSSNLGTIGFRIVCRPR